MAIISPRSEKELVKAVKTLKKLGIRPKVVGACTNILFSENLSGVCLISTQELKGISVEYKNQLVECFAGEKISSCYKECMQKGLSGFEKLVGIPGTIGGAVVMNAGAFGTQMKDVLVSVKVLLPSGRKKVFRVEDLNMIYRNSNLFESDKIVMSATFKLQLLAPSVIRSIAKDSVNQRNLSQPAGLSLGSVFKKVGVESAGMLIERAGLKGISIGGCKISEKHANFIINTGNATSKDFKQLVTHIQKTVKKKFNVLLEREVEYVDNMKIIKQLQRGNNE